MRTTVERRYVFIGSVVDHKIKDKLSELTQAQRDSVIKGAIEELSLRGATGRLGQQVFTIVGGEKFDISMNNIGKNNLEAELRIQIEKAI